jgi:hypothetical protein
LSDRQIIACPGCRTQFEMTRQYIEQFGGQETACSSCGKAMGLPKSWAEFLGEAKGAGQAPVLSYAGPKVKKKRGPAQHWAEGDLLVIEKGAELSPWCVLCGKDALQPHIACTVRWSQGAQESRNRKVKLILSLTESIKMRVRLGLCAKHLARRRMCGWLSVVCALLGVATIVAGSSLQALADFKQGTLVGGILVIMFGLGWLATSRRILTAVYVDYWMAKLKGASPIFLQRLPARELRVRPPDASSSAFDEIR